MGRTAGPERKLEDAQTEGAGPASRRTLPGGMEQLSITTHSRQETQSIAARLAQAVSPGQVIALRGQLGAGKTTFVQGFAVGLGIRDRVTSPTFILANEYRSPRGIQLVHIDIYRLGDSVDSALEEAATFGLEEILEREDAVIVIEWAERVSNALPPDHLQVELIVAGDEPSGGLEACEDSSRLVRFTAFGPQSAALLSHIRP